MAGKSRKTFASLSLRLESGALGYRIAHGVEHSLDALSEHLSVVLGCAGVFRGLRVGPRWMFSVSILLWARLLCGFLNKAAFSGMDFSARSMSG